MVRFFRVFTILVAAVILALSPVARASVGTVVHSSHAVGGDHPQGLEHGAAVAACFEDTNCPGAEELDPVAEGSCCAFSCHAFADIAAGTPQIRSTAIGRVDLAEVGVLSGASQVGLERPPRLA